ncbi:MAG: hypothetical protein ACI4LX_05695 [Treponema sp.]
MEQENLFLCVEKNKYGFYELKPQFRKKMKEFYEQQYYQTNKALYQKDGYSSEELAYSRNLFREKEYVYTKMGGYRIS